MESLTDAPVRERRVVWTSNIAFREWCSIRVAVLWSIVRGFKQAGETRSTMKYVRVTVRPDPERAPAFLAYLLDSPEVTEARAVDWNRGDAALSTHLYAIDGDATGFGELAADAEGVESVALAATGETPSYALLVLRDEQVPVFGGATEAIDRPGLIVRRPLIYESGQIHGHVVGDPDVLQATLDGLPGSVVTRIDEISQFPGARANPATVLSERQREALETALEMGYYDSPRATTHEEIAAELGCAPNTASEHLQKGEAKLVRAGMDTFSASL